MTAILEEYRGSMPVFVLRDKKEGRWFVMRVKRRDFLQATPGVVAISRDYASIDDGPWLEAKTEGDLVAKYNEYGATHEKLTEPSPGYTDKNGAVWFTTERIHGGTFSASARFYALTASYGGVAIDAESIKFLELSIKRVAEDEAAGAPIVAPDKIPNYSDVFGPSKPPVTPPATPPVTPPPPTAKGVAKLSDDDYRAIGAAAKFVGAAPLDLLLVLYRESGLFTTTGPKNSAGELTARGLNQLTFPDGASWVGITDHAAWERIVDMTFAQQIGLVQRYFEKAKRAPYSTATVLYQTNIGPSTVGSNVVYPAGSKGYAGNHQLDIGPKGHISTEDLSIFLGKAERDPAFAIHLARMNALGFPGNPNIAGSGVSMGLLAALGGIAGILIYVARRDSKSAARK